jgi:hypothetical protein
MQRCAEPDRQIRREAHRLEEERAGLVGGERAAADGDGKGRSHRASRDCGHQAQDRLKAPHALPALHWVPPFSSVSPLGVSPLGVSPLGVSPLGVSPLGVSPLGVSPAPDASARVCTLPGASIPECACRRYRVDA